MGCCISRPTGPNSPYPGGNPPGSGSAHAINRAANPATNQSGGENEDSSLPPGATRRHRPRPPLAQRVSKPLRRHEWASRERIWTPVSLARERAEFFETRVTGRHEVWQTIHAALEVMWEADNQARLVGGGEYEDEPIDGERSDEGPAIAVATAQSILTAADITLPTGDLAQGAYDSLGNYYSFPDPIVSDPVNISFDEGKGALHEEMDLGDNKADFDGVEEVAQAGELDDDDDIDRRREEKGKAVVSVEDQIRVRARLSEGSQDVVVGISKGENVRSVARKIAEESGFSSNKYVRIIYMGRILKDNYPLVDQDWYSGSVVNAFVFYR